MASIQPEVSRKSKISGFKKKSLAKSKAISPDLPKESPVKEASKGGATRCALLLNSHVANIFAQSANYNTKR